MGTMKVGKEGEKSMRPMFPRFHVNDAEKGGPRAPPRNKMALYEQLSIPSQKFNSATLRPHKTSTSSMQGDTNERIAQSSFCLPRSMPPSAEPYSCSSDAKSNKTRGMEFERSNGCVDYKISRATGLGAEGSEFMRGTNSFKAKFDDDNDDFRVPTFASSEVAPHSKGEPLLEVNKPTSFGVTNAQNTTTLNSSVHVMSSSTKSIHEANTSGKLSRKRERIHSEQESRGTISSKEHGDKFPNSVEAGEMLASPPKNSSAPSDRGAETNLKFFDKTGHHSVRMGNESSHDGSVENKNAHKMERRSFSGTSFGFSQRNGDGIANGSGELKDAERSDELSEDSMIDSSSVLDICPDDVVGKIGPKQFWKARRAIVNQQRVFAIQVFELHRLIKVQKLFAESPHLLSDDSDIITIQPKALPVVPTLKYQQVAQHSDYSTQKPTQNEDPPVEKTAARPLQTQGKDPNKEICQLPKNVPLTADAHPTPTAPDNRPNPWYFQPPPNQWLIPVMSPSEGLVYKPYAGPCPPPGFMTPLYGSCGPPLQMPSIAGDFMNPLYAFPSCHPQLNRILPGAPAIGPNYFPAPYSLPLVNPAISASAVEQVSPLTNAKSNGRSLQCSQSSCNVSNTKSLSGYPPKHKSSSKDNEVQASTASSLCDMPAFPIPSAAEGSCQPSQSSGRESQTHVIKVIPHNSRSATESAARIFRSIQRERRQLDL